MKIGPVELSLEELKQLFRKIPAWLYCLMGSGALFAAVLYFGIVEIPSLEKKDSLIISTPKSELMWRQREYVSRIAQETSNVIGNSVVLVKSCFPTFRTDSLQASDNFITSSVAREIVEKKENQKLLQELHTVLNYFDAISIAYRNGVADEKMFEDAFKVTLGKWYLRTSVFMDEYKNQCKCDWPAFKALGDKWKPDNLNPAKGAAFESACVISMP